jgi:hypothetical protein
LDILIAVVVGIGSGLTASLIFWYLQYRVFRAQLELSPTLASYKLGEGGVTRTELKLRNRGRRPIIDMELLVRVAVSGLATEGHIVPLSLEEWRRPHLPPNKSVLYVLPPTRLKELTKRWYSHYFNDVQRKLLTGEEFDLIELMEAGSHGDSRLRLRH